MNVTYLNYLLLNEQTFFAPYSGAEYLCAIFSAEIYIFRHLSGYLYLFFFFVLYLM